MLDAAEEIGRRAIEHAEQLLIEGSCGYGFAHYKLEKALESERRIRRLNRTKKWQIILEDAARVRSAGYHSSTDQQAELELKILVDELLTRCDPRGQKTPLSRFFVLLSPVVTRAAEDYAQEPDGRFHA